MKQNKKYSKLCKFCGIIFYKKRNYNLTNWEKAKYCSRSCADKGKAQEKRELRPECMCGCGGKLKAKDRKFISGHKSFEVREKYNKNLNRWVVRHGNKWLYRYRVVMEQFLERELSSSETIHHINENSSDDRLENLKLFSSKADHTKFHHGNY